VMFLVLLMIRVMPSLSLASQRVCGRPEVSHILLRSFSSNPCKN